MGLLSSPLMDANPLSEGPYNATYMRTHEVLHSSAFSSIKKRKEKKKKNSSTTLSVGKLRKCVCFIYCSYNQ